MNYVCQQQSLHTVKAGPAIFVSLRWTGSSQCAVLPMLRSPQFSNFQNAGDKHYTLWHQSMVINGILDRRRCKKGHRAVAVCRAWCTKAWIYRSRLAMQSPDQPLGNGTGRRQMFKQASRGACSKIPPTSEHCVDDLLPAPPRSTNLHRSGNNMSTWSTNH